MYQYIFQQGWFVLAILFATNSIAANIHYLPYTVVSRLPHSTNSFIQGWEKNNGTFYESSGLYGRSFVRRYNAETSQVWQLEDQYFAEGLTLIGDRLYLLTWREQTLFVLDKDSLQIKQRLHYQGEGWGLAYNGEYFIKSNGTSTLSFHRTNDFSVVKTLNIPYVKQLNELEYANNILWANDWKTDKIYAIDLHRACIVGALNLTNLRHQTVTADHHNVLNGIAYDERENGLWVTGKLWPTRYLISTPLLDKETSKSCQQ